MALGTVLQQIDSFKGQLVGTYRRSAWRDLIMDFLRGGLRNGKPPIHTGNPTQRTIPRISPTITVMTTLMVVRRLMVVMEVTETEGVWGHRLMRSSGSSLS